MQSTIYVSWLSINSHISHLNTSSLGFTGLSCREQSELGLSNNLFYFQAVTEEFINTSVKEVWYPSLGFPLPIGFSPNH